MSRHGVLLLSLLCAAVTGLSGRSSGAARPVPFVLHKDGRISLMVRVDGAGPFRFRLDTGASRTVVSGALATRLGLAATGSSRTVTQAGERLGRLVRLGSLELEGGPALEGTLALVVPSLPIEPDEPIDGLLGQDILSRSVYTLDYTARCLVIGGPEAGDGTRLPLLASAGRLLAIVPRDAGRAPLRLVPDTGADRIVLFRSSGSDLPPTTFLELVRVRSIAGEVPARLVRVHGLAVGGTALGDLEALVVDGAPGGGAMGDGLLPLHLFARVTFNVPAGYVAVAPRS